MDFPIKPSEISLQTTYPPLAGTMGKSELEAAATLIVRVSQVLGDKWQALTFDSLVSVAIADVHGGVEPLASLSKNPFWRPDYAELAKRGYAKITGKDDAGEFIALTETGIKALERHRTHVTF